MLQPGYYRGVRPKHIDIADARKGWERRVIQTAR